jgi:hypothetical protein
MTQTQSHPPEAKQPEKKASRVKPKVYFFVSNLGQVGKSTHCKMFIHYLKETKKQNPIILDMDIMNPNVARSYAPELVGSWTNSTLDNIGNKSVDRFRRTAPSKKASQGTDDDKIANILSKQPTFGTTDFDIKFLELTEFNRDIVVNVSGNSYIPFCNFLSSIEADKSEEFDLYICWVTNGAKECLDLFTKTQQRFEGSKFLLTFNEGNNLAVKDWDNYYLTPEISKLDKDKKIKLASLHFVSTDEDYWYEGQNHPYSDWLIDQTLSDHRRRALKVWVDAAILSIKESEILA